MKKIYIVGHIGIDQINEITAAYPPDEANIQIVERIEDIPLTEMQDLPTGFQLKEHDFAIVEHPAFRTTDIDDFFVRRKKPKNEEWQQRIKKLHRKLSFVKQ